MSKKPLTESDLSPSCFIGVQGDDIISFGSGQPDLPPPKEVYSCLPIYKDFKYGTIQGSEKLRQALVKQYPQSTKDDFIITNGASEALDLSLRAIQQIQNNKPNKVLIAKPYYYSYPHLIKFAGLEPVFLKTNKGKIDIDDFKEKVKDCKAIILNSPSNPTGRLEELETLKIIETLTKELEVYVLSDEVYKDLIYCRENYLLSGPHIITINSFSKTYAMCGFRIGYLWSKDESLVQKIIDIKSHTSMNTNILAQEMAYQATKVPNEIIEAQRKIWEERRDLIYNGLKDLGLDIWKPEGAFYVLPKVPNPKQFVLDMYNNHNVITYLGEWFGSPGRVRFSYALDKEKIIEGLKRVKEYLESRN